MKRQLVAEVMTTHELSQRRACGLIGITRRGLKRAPGADRNRGLRKRLGELAEERRRWGCPLLYLMLRREGWRANHKRVERLYRGEGLSLRRKRRRKRLSHLRVARERPVAANQTWAVDFIHDSLISGRHFRAFAVIAHIFRGEGADYHAIRMASSLLHGNRIRKRRYIMSGKLKKVKDGKRGGTGRAA